MSTESSKSERQQHAVPSAGEVEDSLGHHKAHSEEQITCRKKWDNEESQAQRKDPGKWEVLKMAIVRLLKKNVLLNIKIIIKASLSPVLPTEERYRPQQMLSCLERVQPGGIRIRHKNLTEALSIRHRTKFTSRTIHISEVRMTTFVRPY